MNSPWAWAPTEVLRIILNSLPKAARLPAKFTCCRFSQLIVLGKEDKDFVAQTSKEGYLKVLQWLRANDGSWDSKTIFTVADSGGYYELLNWARANGASE